jgi:hypothetical protein
MLLSLLLAPSAGSAAATEAILNVERGFVACLALIQPGGHRADGGCLRVLDHGATVEVSLYRGNRATAVADSTIIPDEAFTTDAVNRTAALTAVLPSVGELALLVSAEGWQPSFGFTNGGRSAFQLVVDDLSESIGTPALVQGTLGGTPITSWGGGGSQGSDSAFWIAPVSGLVSAA